MLKVAAIHTLSWSVQYHGSVKFTSRDRPRSATVMMSCLIRKYDGNTVTVTYRILSLKTNTVYCTNSRRYSVPLMNERINYYSTVQYTCWWSSEFQWKQPKEQKISTCIVNVIHVSRRAKSVCLFYSYRILRRGRGQGNFSFPAHLTTTSREDYRFWQQYALYQLVPSLLQQ